MKKSSLLVLLLSMAMVMTSVMCSFAESEATENTDGEVVAAEEQATVEAPVVEEPAAEEPANVEAPAAEEPVAEEPAKDATEEPAALRGGKTGWDQDEYGYWYYYENDNMVYGWKSIKGYWYYFDKKDGYMYSDIWDEINGKYYYFDNSGHMKTGWVKDVKGYGDGAWYYFSSGGAMCVGWLKIGGAWYYFDEYIDEDDDYLYGQMANGIWWNNKAEKAYLFGSNGKWQSGFTGWKSETYTYDGTKYTDWYYFKKGTGINGFQKFSNKWYYFDGGWMLADNWLSYKGYWYYFDKSGVMKTGWLKDTWTDEEEGVTYITWYYFKSNGAEAFGWQKISGKWYYFDEEDGYMYSDFWDEINGNYYYIDKSGVMKTGWLKDTWTDEEEGVTYITWYYFKSNGAEAFGWQKISNKWYYFDKEDGYMYANAWAEDSKGWYYMDEDGHCVTNKTIEIDGEEYTFGSDGICLNPPF